MKHDHLRAFASYLVHARFSASQLARYLRLRASNNGQSAKQCWNQNEFPHDNLGWKDVRHHYVTPG